MNSSIAEVIDVPGAPALSGLAFRNYRGAADQPALAELISVAEIADGTNEVITVEALANWLDNVDDFEPSRDVLLAEIDGHLVAAAHRTRQMSDGDRIFELHGWVHPDWRRRGLGRAMLRFGEARQLERIATEAGASVPGTAYLGSWSFADSTGNVVLLESEGYRPVRWFFLMERPDLEDIPDAAPPDGIELRPVPADRLRDVILADYDAFQDHWGAHEHSETDIRRRLNDPETDPTLWQVAWAGDEVAGSVIGSIHPAENAALGYRRGWLDRVSVRRAWRQQGVATALMVAALHALKARDIERAVLGVDADNPTGALGLYERLGFHPARRAAAYRKPV